LSNNPIWAAILRHRRGTFRVAGYVGVLFVLGFLLALRSARAEVTTMSLELGRDMEPLSDLLTERARVNINGERLWASSALSTSSVAEVLGRFEANCHDTGAAGASWGDIPGSQMQSFTKNLDVSDPKKAKFEFGVFRSEKGNEGAVLCFPKPGGAGMFDRMQAFVRTQNLGELGRLRYAYVRHDNGKTHVLTMWTDDSLRLDKLAGTDGSEPGFDSPDLPRPIRSKRTVSASIDGTPYGALGYLSEGKPAEVLTAFRDEMEHRGWRTAKTPDATVLGFMKDGSLVTIAAQETKEGTVIGISEMGVDPAISSGQEQGPVRSVTMENN
jgi:hypothetical protein